jgi:hypothetical protein
MSMNFASAVTARQYYSIHGHWGTPAEDFDHTPPTGKPSGAPDISGLTAGEQTAINLWVADVDRGRPTPPPSETATHVAFTSTANTKVSDYVTYFAAAAYKAWRLANKRARESQWRWLCADAHDLAAGALAKTADPAGTGSGATDGSSGVPPSAS